MEPAWRCECQLLVHSDRTLAELDTQAFVDEWFEHAWTLERARHLARTMLAAEAAPRDNGRPVPARPLDPEQLAAVAAHDGVVQVIAPAGSGKTTVLVERVRELLRRGTVPNRILCMTFNNAAAAELRSRLTSVDVHSVEARTFHSTGRWILKEEGMLRGEPRSLSLGEWRRLSALAMKQVGDGTWIDPPEARALVSSLKLGRLLTATEWRRVAPADPESQTLTRLYELYELQLSEKRAHDFDDQIFLAVRALRSSAEMRARWQARFDRVLVDEYQDIEPAQELLVEILAAPQDSLFTVGDEDQVLYGWRRASAGRIVQLDQTYPGLERIALATNYRCPVEVVLRSAQLISRNDLRFPKTIHAAPARPPAPASIEHSVHRSQEAAADWTCGKLRTSSRGEIVVLARTTRLLRTVAEACVLPSVRISAPPAVFEARGARAAVEAHLRLASDPANADSEDVLRVLRNPSRGLPPDSEDTVTQRLRHGASWRQALEGLGRDPRGKLAEAATVLDRLREIDDAQRFVHFVRTTGGLDRHFAEYERTFGGAEQVEIEQLQDAEREARGRTVVQYAALLTSKRDDLLAIRDDEHGMELTTIHGAKGREWPTVVIFGFDTDQLPHKKALEVSPELAAAGEGMEAERRVAYVALTRAKERLHIVATQETPSPFLWQAGIVEEPQIAPSRGLAPFSALGGRSRPGHNHKAAVRTGPLGKAINDITRVGAGYAVRNSPSRSVGLRVAAWAIRHNLVTAENSGATITVGHYIDEVPGIDTAQKAAAIENSGAPADQLVRRLPPSVRGALADELDHLADA
jgi:DNA helicase-2/ATP-dependent DNA helicase PcrA